VLATNDFPPKVGGIQSYLHELWRRLPPEELSVFTTCFEGAAQFDERQSFKVVRSHRQLLLPLKETRLAIAAQVAETGAAAVILDPALPLGLVGKRLPVPYGLVLHGAEVTVPGRLPVTRSLLSSVLAGARFIVAAGEYPETEARRATGGHLPEVIQVPPGVDTDRFVPLGPDERERARQALGLPADRLVVLALHRLVPRKGADVLIRAVSSLQARYDEITLVVGGAGRDRARLERLARELKVPVHFLGRVNEKDKAAVYGCADIYSMCCRDRWAGLEQEGFGIVFLEAAACGVPQLAGASGGAAEAVIDGETGLVVKRPASESEVTAGLEALVSDEKLRARLGAAARERAVALFSYDKLARDLASGLEEVV
jgi:phosphatidylinositol alpha-1,6-mannosyltransferase